MAAAKRGRKPKKNGERRVGLTIKLDPDDKERLRRAAYWLRVDQTAIVEELIVGKLRRLARKHGEWIFEPIPDGADPS